MHLCRFTASSAYLWSRCWWFLVLVWIKTHHGICCQFPLQEAELLQGSGPFGITRWDVGYILRRGHLWGSQLGSASLWGLCQRPPQQTVPPGPEGPQPNLLPTGQLWAFCFTISPFSLSLSVLFLSEKKVLPNAYLFVCSQLLQSCLTAFDTMDSGPLSSSVHEIFPAKILEWIAMPSSRGASWSRDQTCVSCIIGRFFTC